MKKVIWPILGLLVMAIVTTVQQVNADNRISASEWVMVAVQAVMVVNVYLTANLPQYSKMKSYVAAVIVVLQVLVASIAGGLTTNEIINLIIAFVAALGVHFTPQPVTTVINGTTVTPTGGQAGISGTPVA